MNGEPVVTWTCSPAALEALGAGRLLTLGYIRDAGDIRSLLVARNADGHTIDAEVPASAEAAGREDEEHRRRHGCALRFLIDCRPDRLPVPLATSAGTVGAAVPDTELFPALFRELFDRSTSRQEGGGHHTTAVSDGEHVLHVHDEVGRHNGADKALGAALLDGLDLRGLGLLTTARISGEIAEKAARAGLAWVASRSVPTTLVLEIAGVARVDLVGRSASPEARVFLPGMAP